MPAKNGLCLEELWGKVGSKLQDCGMDAPSMELFREKGTAVDLRL